MRTIHYLSLAVALGLIALLYWGVNTVPPPKSTVTDAAHPTPAPNPMAGATAAPAIAPASSDSILAASFKNLSAAAAAKAAALQQKAVAIKDSAAMPPVLKQIADLLLEQKQAPAAAYFYAKSAHLAHSEKNLNFAGQFFLELMHKDGSPSVQAWIAQQAVDCFNEALIINPDNDTTKLALASGYIEGTSEPMKGVAILRGIVAQKPNDIPANLMLGRMSIQSGQFDKAVLRFETVLKVEPRNREALYFLAEAYKSKGDKEKAIALFEQCKQVVNNPAFSKEIDEYINTFK